jgi:hypothetical protein
VPDGGRPEAEVGSLRHREGVHHFCSLERARRFAEDPDAYVDS